MARIVFPFVSLALLVIFLYVSPLLAQIDDLELAPIGKDGEKSSFRKRSGEGPGDLELTPLGRDGRKSSFEKRSEESPEDLELLPLNGLKRDSSFTKRADQDLDDDRTVLELKNFGSFLWGAEAVDSMIVANLTLEVEGDYEAIVDMDQFAGLVKGVDCSAPDLSLDFKDEKSFSYAKKVWDWVNTDDNYRFILVASAHACDPESARDPFVVSKLDFDEAKNRVLMKAVLKEWEEVAVNYSFKVRNEPYSPDSPRLAKRDGKTLDFTKKFNKELFSSKAKGLELGVSCIDCGLEGSLNIDVDIETTWKVPTGASLSVKPRNLAAVLELGMHLEGKLSGAYKPAELTVVSVPITGFKIAKLFKIGAFLNVDVGFELDKWEGTAEASVGAKLTVPNSSKLGINLMGSGDNGISGWVPSFKRIPPSISAKVEGSAEAYAQAGLELTAEGLGKGFTVGLDMKMPYIRADFAAMADQKGVCGGLQTLGVDLEATVGAELSASAALNDDPFWTHTLFDKTLGTLVDKCYAFGPKNAQTGGGNGRDGPRRTTKKKTTKKPTPKTSSKPKKTTTPKATTTTKVSTTSRRPKTTSAATSQAKSTATTASRPRSSTITKVTVTSVTPTASSRPKTTPSSTTNGSITSARSTLTTSTIASTSSDKACPITGCRNCVAVNPTPYFPADNGGNGLERRATKDPINFACTAQPGKFTTKVTPELYYGPREAKKATPAISPAIKPKDPNDCTNYKVENKSPTSLKGYATEHIYEANWITTFLVNVSERVKNCAAMSTLFLNSNFNASPLPMPKDQEDWAGALMSSIGSQENTNLMVYFDSELNSIKYRVFEKKKKIFSTTKFGQANFTTKMGLIANIGRIQNYMTHEDVQKKMRLTADSVEKTLRKFYTEAENSSDPKIKDAFETFKKEFKDQDELAEFHRKVLREILDTGSEEAYKSMIALASSASKSVAGPTQTRDPRLLAKVTSVAKGIGVPAGLRGSDV